jgi:hypothetical protein
VKLSRFNSRRFKFYSSWLMVGVFFYLVDCFVVTLVDETSFGVPWYERGIFALGPFGIVLTLSWLVFPVIRVIHKRAKTRPR